MKTSVRLLIIIFLIAVSLIIGGFRFYQSALDHRQPGPAEPVEFVVSEGEPLSKIAQELENKKLINSALLLRLYVRLSGLGSFVQAGVFSLPQNASLTEVVGILGHGRADIKLTFPEGWRREEMGEYINSKFSAQGGSALSIAEFLNETKSLEGYLFPDTYLVPAWYTAARLVGMMQDNFAAKIKALPKSSLSEKDIVILASILEREARFAEDRPIIAGILLKRLENDWPLEVDATLQYAITNSKISAKGGSTSGGKSQNSKFNTIEWWPKEITATDLELDSPYNTRKYKGLPPTPISNPGFSTMTAVVRPAATGYWFYLSDKEGRMHYAKTLEEHNLNAGRYLSN
ncbi:MAG: endolytic transglycosylase MltG [Patescibacteria group bacterium]